MKKGRLLALDYGDVRIGVAISDPLGMTAQPVGTIRNSATAIAEIVAIITDKKVETVILGLPKNQHGGDSKKAESVRAFGDKLKEAIDITIEFVDERFSTVASERHLMSLNMKRKKRKEVLDTQAAMFFLQGVLDGA